MRLATYSQNGQQKIGVVSGARGHETVFDLAAGAQRSGSAAPAFASMLALIDAGPSALDTARALVDRAGADPALSLPLASVELQAPLPEPRQMRDAMSFATHILQAPAGMQKLIARLEGRDPAALPPMPQGELPALYRQQPIYYITNRFSVRGPGHTVRWPRYSRYMDFELEFGIVTAGRGANIGKAAAKNHIFGYTIFNDFSARDAQYVEMQARLGPAKGKSFDGGNVLGPWIVTPDEIGDPYALAMTARINGQTWTRGTTAGMLHSFEDMLAFISRDETIMPGEFIGSGTVGNGCGLEQDRYLQHGDTVELEVEKIGILANRVERQDM